MKKIFLICSLLVSAVVFGQPVVQRANPINTVADGRWMGNLNSFQPRYADTTAANISKGIDSAGAIIYTYDIKGFWYRQHSPKKWVRIVADNNLSDNFFYDSTCNCYKIDTTSLINIINNYLSDSSIISISILNDSTLTICYPSGCVNIGITTSITNISNVYWLGGDTISVCAIDTTGGVSTQVCDTITLGVQPTTSVYQNWLRNTGSDIIEFGSGSPSTSPGLMLNHDTYANTGYYKMNWHGYSVYDYIHTFKQQQSFQNSTGIASFDHVGNQLLSQPNSVRLGINYSADTVNVSPFIEGYFGSAIGYSLGANWTGHSAYGVYLDNNNSKTTGIFFHTTDSTTNDGVTIYAAPDLGGTAPILNGLLKNYKVAGFKTNLGLQLYGYGSGSSFLTSDTTNKKPLGVDANGNVYRMNSWFGGGGTDSAFVKITAINDTAAIWERSNRSIPADTLRISLAPGDKGDVVVYGGWDNWQLDVTGVSAGTYTNPTITVDSKGRITAASNGSSGGSVNDFRLLPFQIDSSRNAPASGASYFLLPSSYSTKRIIFYREGEEQRDTTNGVKDYQYLRHNDTVFVFPNFSTRERCLVQAYPDSNWTVDNFTVVSYDSDAETFFTAAGISNTTQKDATNQFVLDLKAASLWTGMKALYPYVGGTSSSHAVNLKTPGTYDITWSGSLTHDANGVTGDGASGYGNTGLNDTVLQLNAVTVGAYSRTNDNLGFAMGAYGDGATNKALYMADRNSMIVRIHDESDFSQSMTPTRLMVMTRTASNNIKMYRDGTALGSASTTASTGKSIYNIYLLAFNSNGSAAGFSSKNYALHFIYDGGMSDAQVTALTNAVNTFETALGRNL